METGAGLRAFWLVPDLQGAMPHAGPSGLSGELSGANQPGLDPGLACGQRARAKKRARQDIGLMRRGSTFLSLPAGRGKVGVTAGTSYDACGLSDGQAIGCAVLGFAGNLGTGRDCLERRRDRRGCSTPDRVVRGLEELGQSDGRLPPRAAADLLRLTGTPIHPVARACR